MTLQRSLPSPPAREKRVGLRGPWPKGLLLGGRDWDGGAEGCQHESLSWRRAPTDFCGPLSVLGDREQAAIKLGVPFSDGEEAQGRE